MSYGDYVGVFVSIILGIAVADLLMSAHHLLRARGRVEWHWVSPSLAVYMLVQVLATWWATFQWYRKLDNFTIGDFLPDVAVFVSLFLVTAAVLPDEIPEGRFSLREYYFREAPYFWSLMSLFAIANIVTATIAMPAGSSWRTFVTYQGDNLFCLLLGVALIVTRRAWIHYLVIAILSIDAARAFLPWVLGN